MTNPSPAPYQLDGVVATVKLNGSGNGTAKITPGAAGAPGSGVGAGRQSGLSWDIIGVAVQVATNVLEATANCYISYGIQSAGQADFVGQTQTGSTGDTGSFTAHLLPGDWITVVWTGGDANALATMRILGTVNPPGVG
jgi:hypothetical protein